MQRRFVRLRWHCFDADGKGILVYEVRGDRKTGRLNGLVVRDPEGRLGVSRPEPVPDQAQRDLSGRTGRLEP